MRRLHNSLALVLAVAGAAATVLFLLLSGGRAVAQGEPARATLVRLTDQDVPAIGLTSYTGTYGTAVSEAEGDDDPGDFSDPDGVLDRLSIATETVRTSATASENSAEAQLTALDLRFNERSLVNVASSDSYAECVPPPIGPLALAYNRSDAGEITVLGQRVSTGTTELSITGADLGLPSVGPSTLTVTVTRHQDPVVQSPQLTASAWLDIEIDGRFTDTEGTTTYDGPVTALRLGEVEVTCDPVIVTTTTDTTTTTTPTTSDTTTSDTTTSDTTTTTPTTSDTTTSDTTATTAPTSTTSMPTTTTTTTSPEPTGPTGPTTGTPPNEPSPTTPQAPDDSGHDLARTGTGGLLWQTALSLVLIIAGLVAVLAARRTR